MITDSDGDYDTYWYGTYDNGYGLYNPGSVMTLYYTGYFNYPGFQLVYYPADPGKFIKFKSLNFAGVNSTKKSTYSQNVEWVSIKETIMITLPVFQNNHTF